jgi:cytochrome P450
LQDPETFKPDRWYPSNPDAEKLKELYLPFSMGKRNCVGQNLAMFEMKMVLATVFKSYRFELVSEVDHDYFMTLKPTNAHVRVHCA